MKQHTQPPTQPTLNLLATFDELAASQPAALAREMAEAGLPDEAIQTAQVELSVALAGMRSAVDSHRTSLAEQLGLTTDENAERIVASERQRLEDELEQARKDARKLEQEARIARTDKVDHLINAGASDAAIRAAQAEALPLPIDVDAIRKRNAAYLKALPDTLRSRSADDETAIRRLLDDAIADAEAHVADRWLAMYLRAQRELEGGFKALINRVRERTAPSDLLRAKQLADKPAKGERSRGLELPDGVTITPISGARGSIR